VRGRWIIGRKADLALILGGAAAGYLYLVLFAALHAPASLLWWFWSIGFDGTHIFATASRTYFDAEARATAPGLLYGSLVFFFLLGPAMVLAGATAWLALLVGVWAYYHVVRQHYGLLVLYNVKYEEKGPLDQWFLYVMLIAPPFHRFFIHHPEELGLPFSLAAFEPAMWTAVAGVSAAWLWRQARARSRNLPKLLLLATVIPLHWLTFAYVSWQAAVPTVTIVHNLQYHALVWLHNRNRYAGREGHGWLPAAVSRSLVAYVALALAFSVLYRVPGFHLGRVSDLAFGFFCGFGLTHYWLDSRIWRVRHDPLLRRALGLA
jgi:hypothetical protein